MIDDPYKCAIVNRSGKLAITPVCRFGSFGDAGRYAECPGWRDARAGEQRRRGLAGEGSVAHALGKVHGRAAGGGQGGTSIVGRS